MNIIPLLLYPYPGWAFRHVAKRHISSTISPEMANAIWNRCVTLQKELKQSRPKHSIGVNLVIQYMEWNYVFYKAALESNIPHELATQWIEEINWTIFDGPIAITFHASRVRSARINKRVRWVLDLLFATVFTRPFKREIRSDDGLAFDVITCPIADYFRSHDKPELTKHAACSLDYRMAKKWGVTLNRTQTIAEGCPVCDFRFSVPFEKNK